MDVVGQIRSFNAGREGERLALKYRAMRASPFAFLRGSCHLFYAQLPRGGAFKSAPLAWTCGDLHLENFGSFKGDNRLTYFDVNDFDESALAPATWDLLRLVTSLQVAADDLALSPARALALSRACVDAHAGALASGKAYWVERDTASGLIGRLLEGLQSRSRASFLDARTVFKRGQRRLRVDGRRALAVTEPQRHAVASFMQTYAGGQTRPEFFKVLDVARRIAGTGSLGVERYVILVQGKGSPDGNYLLDLKLALPSSLLARLKVGQPRWPSEAHRVVAVQRRMQAVSMAFLEPVCFADRPFVLRALQPSEDRVTTGGTRLSASELEQLVVTLGQLVAWAQLRSAGRDGSAIADELIDFGRRKKWRERLLDVSHGCAAQVRRDAATFNAAWDDGAFDA